MPVIWQSLSLEGLTQCLVRPLEVVFLGTPPGGVFVAFLAGW